MSKRILFQGDSITDCGRSKENENSKGHGYATMVAGVLGAQEPFAYEFFNRGIGGNRVCDLLSRIRMDMVHLKPDYMSILIGVNDVWHEYTRQNGVRVDRFERIYSMILDELKEELPDLKIMLMEPYVLPGSATCNTEEHPARWEFFRSEVELRAQAVRRLAEKYGLVFVPLQERLDQANENAPEGYWLRDGVHPTPAGHELIKQAWLEGFEKLR